jgi:hypothetical protein
VAEPSPSGRTASLCRLPKASILTLCRPQRRQGRLYYEAGLQYYFAGICHSRGITVSQLAAKLLITSEMLTDILRGEREVPVGLAGSLAHTLTAGPAGRM